MQSVACMQVVTCMQVEACMGLVIQVNCRTILLALWCRCAHGSVLYPMLGVVYPMLDVFCTPAATRG